MIEAIKLLLKNINPLFIVSIIITAILSGFIVSHFKDNTINYLNNKIQSINNAKLLQDKEYADKIILIENNTKVKEKENYERYQKTLKDNQSIIDNLNTNNSGLRIKVRNLQAGKIESTNLGDGTGAGSGFEAELDIANSRELVKISNRCDIYKEQLKALQDYINTYNNSFK